MHSFWLLLLLFVIKLYSHIDILKEIGSHNCHNLCLSHDNKHQKQPPEVFLEILPEAYNFILKRDSGTGVFQ